MGRLSGVSNADIINLAEQLYHVTVEVLMGFRVNRSDAMLVGGMVQNEVEGLLDHVR